MASSQDTRKLTDNELIAEFMGLKYEKDPFVRSQKKYWHYQELGLMSETLDFDTSWDWLMPSIRKAIDIYGVDVCADLLNSLRKIDISASFSELIKVLKYGISK